MAREQPTRITVRVQPNASRNAIVRLEDGVLHVKIAAIPQKGKANQTLIVFLSDILGVKRSAISIERGDRSRMKVITVEGLTQAELNGQIESLFT